MTYQMPTTQNITGLLSLVKYVNTVTNNLFSPMFLFSFFIISFISLKAYSTQKALLVSSAIIFIASVFFFSIGIIDIKFVIIFLVLLGGSVVYDHFSGEE